MRSSGCCLTCHFELNSDQLSPREVPGNQAVPKGLASGHVDTGVIIAVISWAKPCPCHPAWQPGQAETAAEGGADRSSAKNEARLMHQSCEAHRSVWPLHFPVGGHGFLSTDERSLVAASSTVARLRLVA